MTKMLKPKVSLQSSLKWFVIISIIFYSTHSFSQSYKGTIGNYPVFLQLDADYDDNSATASYFYMSSLKNIPLNGSYQGSLLVLCERFSEEEDKKELFRLKFNDDELSGTWQNGQTILNVSLTKTSEDFEKYKLQKITFLRDSISAFGTKELVWFNEKYSQKRLFRLGNGFTKKQREFFNIRLDSIHTSYAAVFLECGWADFNIIINSISDRYFSFSEYASIYCGGAHPNYNISGYNFDIKDLKVLNEITDIYPQLDHYTLLKKKYKNDGDLDSECEYFLEGNDYWEYVSWVITEEGIAITPSYPHALTSCETSFLLTYEELEANN